MIILYIVGLVIIVTSCGISDIVPRKGGISDGRTCDIMTNDMAPWF